MWVAAALLCTTIGASYAALNYYSQAESYKKNFQTLMEDLEDLTIVINMKIDYGNGTANWYNNTRVPLDACLLTATKTVADVDYSVSELGAFVDKINNIGLDPNTFWLWSYWDRDSGICVPGPVGCDQWVLRNGDIVLWTYTKF